MSRRPTPAALIGPVANLTEELKATNSAAVHPDGECSICYDGFKMGEEVAYSEACVMVRENGTISRHIYHLACMQGWVNSRSLGGSVPCPACRKILSDGDMAAFGARNSEPVRVRLGLLRDAPVVRRTPRAAGGGLFGDPIRIPPTVGRRPQGSFELRSLDPAMRARMDEQMRWNRLHPGWFSRMGRFSANLTDAEQVAFDSGMARDDFVQQQGPGAAVDNEFVRLTRMYYPSWVTRVGRSVFLNDAEQAAFDRGMTYYDFVQSQIRIQGTRVVIKKEHISPHLDIPRTHLESLRQLNTALHTSRFPGDEEEPTGIVRGVAYWDGRQGRIEYAVVMFESLVVAEFGPLVDYLHAGKVRVPLSWLELA